MNENKTLSILHRLPVVLAVTAASYGLNIANAQTPERSATQANKARVSSVSQAPAKPVR